jgi:hypothetical protein
MTATPTRDRVSPEQVNTTPLRRPEWIKVRAPQHFIRKEEFAKIKGNRQIINYKVEMEKQLAHEASNCISIE